MVLVAEKDQKMDQKVVLVADPTTALAIMALTALTAPMAALETIYTCARIEGRLA